MTEQLNRKLSRREWLKLAGAGSVALCVAAFLSKDALTPNSKVLDTEEVKEIIATTAAPLGNLAEDLNRPDIAQRYFQQLSLESTNRSFDRQTMVEGLVPDPNYKNNDAAFGNSGRILYAYLYEFSGHLYFRNKNNKITDLPVEPWDRNSNKTMPF